MLLTVSGCGSWEENTDPLTELIDYYNVETEQPPLTTVTAFTLPYYAEKTLDPITCDDGIQRTVSTLLYEGLYQLDLNFVPQPVLAASGEYDSAACTYTITVRSDAVFSDGSPVTARDVAERLTRYLRHSASRGTPVLCDLEELVRESYEEGCRSQTVRNPLGYCKACIWTALKTGDAALRAQIAHDLGY